MPSQPFRFIHASDFHLEQPLYGFSEIPDHLRNMLIDAPYIAAQRVFEAAVMNEVDFLVLSGDILHCDNGGPRAISFLLEQFERLAERQIAVYWAGGRVDSPDRWPSAVQLPANVRFFPQGRADEQTHFRGDRPLAKLMGLSGGGRQVNASDFHPGLGDQFTIAVAHGRADAEALAEQGINYWALGRSHRRKTLFTTPGTAHYCGTHQARSPRETGAHGCTLVHVDQQGQVRSQLITMDAVRFRQERITLDHNAKRDDLERQLRDRVQSLVADAADRSTLISWNIEAAERIGGQLRHGGLADELVALLRRDFGHGSPPIWTISLELEPHAAWPDAYYQEDTISGDFLRAVRDYENDELAPLDFEPYLSERHLAGSVASAVQLDDPPDRRRVLRDAAALAVALLRGDEQETRT